MNWYFIKKIVLEKEIKLKEFNFKMLHGILSCKKNLKQSLGKKIRCHHPGNPLGMYWKRIKPS